MSIPDLPTVPEISAQSKSGLKYHIMGTVQHWCEGGVDRVRHPFVPAFREHKEPIIRNDDGLHAGLEAGACRRIYIHAMLSRSAAGGRHRCR